MNDFNSDIYIKINYKNNYYIKNFINQILRFHPDSLNELFYSN